MGQAIAEGECFGQYAICVVSCGQPLASGKLQPSPVESTRENQKDGTAIATLLRSCCAVRAEMPFRKAPGVLTVKDLNLNLPRTAQFPTARRAETSRAISTAFAKTCPIQLPSTYC